MFTLKYIQGSSFYYRPIEFRKSHKELPKQSGKNSRKKRDEE